MKTVFRVFFILSLLTFSFSGWHGNPALAKQPTLLAMAAAPAPAPAPAPRYGAPKPNIKYIPAFPYATVGLEFEWVPPSTVFTAGLVGFYKYGNGLGSNRSTIRPEEYQENGYRLEIFGRYFFKKLAPTGLFVEGKIHYNTMMFSDGNPIPFSLFSHPREEVDGVPQELQKPKEIGFGLAGGFQATIVPKILIANVKLGTEFNQDANNNFLISLYLQPSIGYMF